MSAHASLHVCTYTCGPSTYCSLERSHRNDSWARAPCSSMKAVACVQVRFSCLGRHCIHSCCRAQRFCAGNELYTCVSRVDLCINEAHALYYVHDHTCTCASLSLSLSLHTHTHTHTHMYVRIYTHMHTCMHAYMHVFGIYHATHKHVSTHGTMLIEDKPVLAAVKRRKRMQRTILTLAACTLAAKGSFIRGKVIDIFAAAWAISGSPDHPNPLDVAVVRTALQSACGCFWQCASFVLGLGSHRHVCGYFCHHRWVCQAFIIIAECVAFTVSLYLSLVAKIYWCTLLMYALALYLWSAVVSCAAV
jgi:hypothetical protein